MLARLSHREATVVLLEKWLGSGSELADNAARRAQGFCNTLVSRVKAAVTGFMEDPATTTEMSALEKLLKPLREAEAKLPQAHNMVDDPKRFQNAFAEEIVGKVADITEPFTVQVRQLRAVLALMSVKFFGLGRWSASNSREI